MPGALFPVQYFRPFVPSKRTENSSAQKEQVAGGVGRSGALT